MEVVRTAHAEDWGRDQEEPSVAIEVSSGEEFGF